MRDYYLCQRSDCLLRAILVLFLFSYWLFFLEKKLAKMRKKPASQPINQPAHAQCFAAAARQRTGLSTQSTW